MTEIATVDTTSGPLRGRPLPAGNHLFAPVPVQRRRGARPAHRRGHRQLPAGRPGPAAPRRPEAGRRGGPAHGPRPARRPGRSHPAHPTPPHPDTPRSTSRCSSAPPATSSASSGGSPETPSARPTSTPCAPPRRVPHPDGYDGTGRPARGVPRRRDLPDTGDPPGPSPSRRGRTGVPLPPARRTVRPRPGRLPRRRPAVRLRQTAPGRRGHPRAPRGTRPTHRRLPGLHGTRRPRLGPVRRQLPRVRRHFGHGRGATGSTARRAHARHPHRPGGRRVRVETLPHSPKGGIPAGPDRP